MRRRGRLGNEEEIMVGEWRVTVEEGGGGGWR